MGALLERLRGNFANQTYRSASSANPANPLSKTAVGRIPISTVSAISTTVSAQVEGQNAELPARVRQRFAASCRRIKVDSELVLNQFDAWRYDADNLREMAAWDEQTIEAHCQLLANEIQLGIEP